MANLISKRWKICSCDGFNESSLKELGVSSLTAQVLYNRGIHDVDQARRFLFPTLSDLPDPFSMKDTKKAVVRILRAVRGKEKITIFGDYDVDGITATALLLLFLKKAGAVVDFYLPHRLQEGYGLNIGAVKKIKAQGTKLMVTVDCGVSSAEEIRWAMENGMEVVVTDHHEIPEMLPNPVALLNPKQNNCSYPFKELAGVGVIFNLIIALRSTMKEEDLWKNNSAPNLKEYLDLVALGTVADIVPLVGVNRILVKHGLKQLTGSNRPGISALKEISGVGESPIDATGINFRFAPRINAAGRMGDAREAVRLLMSEDKKEARAIAAHLDQLNSMRQRIEEKIFLEARNIIQSSSILPTQKSFVLASPDWHPGVIGIVASRLTEEYNRPVILIALQENKGKGSGRSIDPFPLYEGLKACAVWMEAFGGHKQAAGLVIRQENIGDFSRAFEEVVNASLKEDDFIPALPIDTFAQLNQLNESFLAELESLSPFGAGNPAPIFGVEDLTVMSSRPVGRSHLRLRLKEGRAVREAIGFNMASRHPLTLARARMAFSPAIGFYQGKKTLELKIVDIQLPSTQVFDPGSAGIP